MVSVYTVLNSEVELQAAIDALIKSGGDSNSSFSQIVTYMGGLATQGSDALNQATKIYTDQLDQWNDWTDQQLTPALQEEAQDLQKIKNINDNAVVLVNLVKDNANNTLADVDVLINENLSAPSDLVSAFQITLQETVDSMKNA